MKRPESTPDILRHYKGRFTGFPKRASGNGCPIPVTQIRLKSHPHVTFSFTWIRNLLSMRGAFVVRLAQGTNPSGGHFEGSVEEVDSGKELKFQSSTELLRFLGERFQAASKEMPEDDSPITPENKSKP